MRGSTFKAGGDAFTLRFSFGALCRYEELTDSSLVEGLRSIQGMGEDIRFKSLVPIIQAGLFDTHPEISEREVMALDFENIKAVIEAIGDAALKAFPDEEPDEGNVKKRKKAA